MLAVAQLIITQQSNHGSPPPMSPHFHSTEIINLYHRMSFRKLLYHFSSSSSFLNPLSKYIYRNCISNQGNCCGALLHFTTVSSPLPSQHHPEEEEDILFVRLLRVSNINGSIIPVLNQWVGEGKQLPLYDVRKIIKHFRKHKRFSDALQISEWMTDAKHFNLTPGDAAVQLDLISKVHGLEKAEKFFNCIPDESKLVQNYGSLLKCYADAKALDKAEALLEKMRGLGFAKTLSYNVMLNVYNKMGDRVKFNSLLQEMEDKGISNDHFTYNFRLNAYSAASDIVGMEKLLMKMEIDPYVTIDWLAYSVAADGYLKIGALEKAKMVLKKFEQLVRGRSATDGYCSLITQYARLGMKEEIYRIWNQHKNSRKFYNTIYILLMSSLVKLDDLVGAENLLEEWHGKMKFFDNRVPHLLIGAYCKKGYMDKAESVMKKVIEGGNEPRASTWSCMAMAYSSSNQMEKAVDMLEKAITTSHRSWEPDIPTLARCLEYLDSKGGVDRAKNIIALLEERGKFSIEFKDRLVECIRKEQLGFGQMEQEIETLEAEEIFGDSGLQSECTS